MRAYLAVLGEVMVERVTCYRVLDLGRCDDCPSVAYIRKLRWQKPGKLITWTVHEPSCPFIAGVTQ